MNSLAVMMGEHLATNCCLWVPISAPPNELIKRGFSTLSELGSSYTNGSAPPRYDGAMLSEEDGVYPFGKLPTMARATLAQLVFPRLMLLATCTPTD